MRPLVIATMVAALGTAGQHAYAEPPLKFEAESTGRLAFVENGEVRGYTVELLRLVLARTEVKAGFEILPWQRAYADARSDPGTCVFPTTVTDERKPLFKWVGPLTSTDWALLARKDRDFPLATIDDARPYVIGVYKGDARETYLRGLGFRVESTPDTEATHRMLLAGRIDLWASSTRFLADLVRRGETNLRSVLVFRTVDLSLACNTGVPDPVIAKLGAALDAIRAAGDDKAIEEAYLD